MVTFTSMPTPIVSLVCGGTLIGRRFDWPGRPPRPTVAEVVRRANVGCKVPALRRFSSPRDYKYIPTDVNWETLPSAWWTTYEATISIPIKLDNRVMVYCRLPQYPPTLEELTQTY